MSSVRPASAVPSLAPTARFLCGAAWAFVRRGVATFLSYRAKLSLGLASLALSVLTFTLVGRVVEAAGPGFAERYGTDYASFAVLGACNPVSRRSICAAIMPANFLALPYTTGSGNEPRIPPTNGWIWSAIQGDSRFLVSMALPTS